MEGGERLEQSRPDDDDFSVDKLADGTTKYDPDGFYIGSTGPARSRGKLYYHYVAPAVLSQIMGYISDRRFPYRSTDDWRRDSDIHNLERLARHKDTGPVLSGELEILARAEIAASQRAIYLDMVDADQNRYDELTKILRGHPYPELVKLVEEQIPGIHSDDLRRQLQAEFDMKFRYGR